MQNDTPCELARTMHRAATLFLTTLLACGMAKAQYIPPDPQGGEHRGTDVLRRNDGQTYGTDGYQRRDVKAYFEGSPVGIYLRDSSRVAFT